MIEIDKAVIDLDSITEAYRLFMRLHDNVFSEESLDIVYALMYSGKAAWMKYYALCHGNVDHDLRLRTPVTFQ